MHHVQYIYTQPEVEHEDKQIQALMREYALDFKVRHAQTCQKTCVLASRPSIGTMVYAKINQQFSSFAFLLDVLLCERATAVVVGRPVSPSIVVRQFLCCS